MLASATGSKQRDHVRKLLRDRRLHRLYAFDVLRRLNRLGTATPATVEELATRCNVFIPVCNERVITRYVDKGSGRRWVHDFGPIRRMKQALVAAILRKLHPPLPAQALFNGGMPKALKAIATAYRDGMTHGVEVDIVDFYGSVRLDRLAELLRPLPHSVVEHVVWDVDLHGDAPVVVGDTTGGPPSSALMGLSLGAVTSPIVGERIVRELLAVARLPDTITYADNLFVLGRSEEEVDTRIETLRDSTRKLEVGALELRTGYSHRHELTRHFVFLKQDGVASGAGEQSRIDWSPGASKLNQYRISATERRLSISEIDGVAARVRHWRRSYPNWQDGDVREAEYLAGLATRRFYIDGNAANLSAAVHAIVVAYVANGCVVPVDLLVPTEGDNNHQTRHVTPVDALVPPEGDDNRTKRQILLAAVNGWLEGASSRLPAA